MPYYQGDYYRGDYYRGDFLGIGKALKKVAGIATGVVSKLGIPVISGAAGAVHGLLAGGTVQPPQLQPSFALQPYQPMMSTNVAASSSVPTFYDDRGGRRPGDTGRVGHFKKDGTWTNRARPRMNVTNVRALKKAGRRVRGFLKLASRMGALPISRSGKGKLFKRKRSR